MPSIYERLRGLIGYGIFCEAVLVLIINFFYLIILKYNYGIDIIGDFRNKLSTTNITEIRDIILILTSLIVAIGITYHLGYWLRCRIRDGTQGGFIGGNLKEHVIPYGALFFLVFFLPFLLSILYALTVYIIINFVLVFAFGYFNEKIVHG